MYVCQVFYLTLGLEAKIICHKKKLQASIVDIISNDF